MAPLNCTLYATMKCFRHPTADAHGFCKVCCKGLCLECGVDLGHSFTSTGNCAAEAERLETIVKPNMLKLHEQSARVGNEAEALLQTVAARSGGRYFIPALLLLTGIPFLVIGITRSDRLAMVGFLGGAFIVILHHLRNRQLERYKNCTSCQRITTGCSGR